MKAIEGNENKGKVLGFFVVGNKGSFGTGGPGDQEIRGGGQGVEGHGALGILYEKFDAISSIVAKK